MKRHPQTFPHKLPLHLELNTETTCKIFQMMYLHSPEISQVFAVTITHKSHFPIQTYLKEPF